MTTEQALEFLKHLASLSNAPLQAHIQAQQAYDVLKQKLAKKEGE
jgi:hypothetical protein